ncbi:MAG: hypothetical protein Ct9H90mP28_2350 [Paracoccaceae bacterium]|jgi:ERCC4-type nuclease|nr:MAG: hypothetical protein Ct9H90mP28_2350 [Paracoccaceae bacterium]
MNILIDYREQAMKTILDDNLVTYMNLQIGDIQIIQDNPEKTPIIVLERKTIQDLQHSLKDGRFSEQKKRMNASNFIHKGFIIEGKVSKFEPQFESILKQIIIRIQLKDKMVIFLTGDIRDTTNLILEIKRKLLLDSKLYNHSQKQTDYIDTLHVSKKQNLTPSLCYILQLSQIPGISKSIAKVIAEKYPNWILLINGIQDKVNFVQALKSAKIGEKRYMQLYQYLTISPP